MSSLRQISTAFGPTVVKTGNAPFWVTAVGSPDTAPSELSALGEHVGDCNGSRGRMFALRCAADALTGFMAPRFVTTLVLVSVILGVISLVV